MIQGLDQLQQAADYHFHFRRQRLFGLGLAPFGLLLGWVAVASRENAWIAATAAVAALWLLAYAALLGDPLGRGWLRDRPFAGHWLLAGALLILGGLALAERRFAPLPPGQWPRAGGGLIIVAAVGIAGLAVYHWTLGRWLWGKRRPLPGMLKQLDEQIAAIKGGDLARDRSLIEFTTAGSGKMRAALRPGMVVLLARDGHLWFYRRKEFAITPEEPGRATLRLAGDELEIAIAPAMLERFQAGGR